MAQENNTNECASTCWIVAGLAGLLSMILLYWLADFSAFPAIITGILIGIVLGFLLIMFFCNKQSAAADVAGDSKTSANVPAGRSAEGDTATTAGAAAAASADAVAGGTSDAASAGASAGGDAAGADATAPAGTMAAVSNASSKPFVMQPTKELPGQKELAARKGAWKYEKAPAAPATSAAPSAPAADPVTTASAPEPAAPAKAPEPTSAAAPAAATAEAKPALMDAPGAGGKDNLQLIGGIGPKLEQTLNEMGIWHFDQVAKWGKAEIAWVDARIRFKGRIERDDWMSQAKVLAEGGETQFSQKKKKT